MGLRAVVKRTSFVIEQGIRIVGMQLVLRPAAYVLPRYLGIWLAGTIALLLLLLPFPGLAKYREMRKAFGHGGIQSCYLTWRWLARPFVDFVSAERCIAGRETPGDLGIMEYNAESINALRGSGESYIIALGHFAREAVGALYLPSITPGHIVIVSVPLPGHSGRLGDIRTRLQLGTLLKAGYAVHLGNGTFVFTKSKQPASGKIYAELQKPGNTAFINIDAPVEGRGPGFVWRAFAGHKKRAFSMGAVKLARLSGCAIIGCVCFKKGDGTTVIEWGDAIRCSEGEAKAEEMSAMNKLVDGIELAIGRRPDQYVLDIGDERRWDAQREEWQDL